MANKKISALTEATSVTGSEVIPLVQSGATKMAKQNLIAKNIHSVAGEESATLGAELLDGTGWTLGAGWTGDFATGFIHATGNTENLTRTMTSTGTKMYQIVFTVTSPTSSYAIAVTMGNSATYELYTGAATTVTYRAGIKSVSDGNLIFIPETGFDGTITNISVKEITAASSASHIITDSASSTSCEIRPTLAALSNLFIGQGSGQYNTTGFGNASVGKLALSNNTTGYWNMAVGYATLQNNSVGSRNVAIGYAALQRNISGHRNQSIGSFSLNNNTTGYKNIAIGSDCMNDNTTGYHNVAVGYQSLYNNETGNDNVSIGQGSMLANTEGIYNVSVGTAALGANTTGDYNVCIGYSAGDTIQTGSNNIIIGYNADVPANNSSNILNIGNTLYGDLNTDDISIGQTAVDDSANSYSGTKLYVGKNADKGVIDLKLGTDADNTVIGILGFVNVNNGDTSGATRKPIAYISGVSYTTDANADKDSGGILKFYTKPEAGALAERMVLENNGRLGVGVTAPTAILHLKACTASANTASLKIDAGTLATTPVSGNIESDGTHIYWTDSGGNRKQLDN